MNATATHILGQRRSFDLRLLAYNYPLRVCMMRVAKKISRPELTEPIPFLSKVSETICRWTYQVIFASGASNAAKRLRPPGTTTCCVNTDACLIVGGFIFLEQGFHSTEYSSCAPPMILELLSEE